MLFHSIDFLIFFPLVVCVYFLIPQRLKNLWLLVASYYFYMNWNAKYALLLLGASLITYAGAICVDKVRDKKCGKQWVLLICLLIVFGILGYYKYTNFVLQSVGALLGRVGVGLTVPYVDIILPVGISFFTFQSAGYLIDVYRGEVEVEHNLLRYLLFVSFFPQLVAGPIERSKHLLAQMQHTNTFDVHRVQKGLSIMLWGYFLKLVIADRCAAFVNAMYYVYPQHGFCLLFLAAVLFAIQIYCDFMGYSTIARGAAMVLGYELMDNFRQPYFATTIPEFWRRWHISLSTWFKDYLYIPLGGNRCSKPRHYLNLMITFLVSGLWHGADWTFVIWGGLHGALQVLSSITRPVCNGMRRVLHIETENRVYRIFCILRTDFLVVIAWVFFRAENIWIAKDYLLQMFTGGLRLEEVMGGNLYNFELNPFHFHMLLLGVAVLFVVSILRERKIAVYGALQKQHVVVRYAIYMGLVLMITLSLSLTGQEFIYFQF